MNRKQMNAAICAAREVDMGPSLVNCYPTADERRSFIAGMRAAAEIADQALFYNAADEIKRAADSLEDK